MRPELVLLLLGARRSLGADGGRRLLALDRDRLDWPWLQLAALRHGLLPLVHRHLLAVVPDLGPAPLRAELDDLAEQSAPLPEAAFPLYTLLRPLRLAWKYRAGRPR